jgi:coenzyme Q-binding protein COQ10
VVLTPDDPAGMRIKTIGIEGPFKALASDWLFWPHPKGTEIVFSLEFEFRSLLLQQTMRMLFAEAVKRMVAAFEARAFKLYGEATRGIVTP